MCIGAAPVVEIVPTRPAEGPAVVEIVPVLVVEIVPVLVVEIVPVFAKAVSANNAIRNTGQRIDFKLFIVVSWRSGVKIGSTICLLSSLGRS